MTTLFRTGKVKPKPAPKAAAPTFAEQARTLLNPSINGAAAAIGARVRTGTQAIGGYTDNLANALMAGPEQARAAYAPSITGTAAVENALANRLSGGGEQLSNDLSARLASINAPGATDPALASVRQTGVGAGNASFAKGSASLEALMGNQASAQGFAQKMPGIARLGGLQQIGALQGQAQSSIADKTAELLGQLPGLAQNLRSQAESTRQFGVSRADRKHEFDTQRADALKANGVKAQSGQAAAGLAQANRDRSYDLDYARTFGVDPKTGQPTLAAVKAAQAADAKASKKTAGLSAATYARLKEKAVAAADQAYYGVEPKQHYDATNGYTAVPGTGVSGISYGETVRLLVSKYSLTPKDAVKVANDYYAPGERGRPMAALPKHPKPDTGFRAVTIPGK